MTRPIRDKHIRKDDLAPETNPGNAYIIDEHKIVIQYLQQCLRRLQLHLYLPLRAQWKPHYKAESVTQRNKGQAQRLAPRTAYKTFLVQPPGKKKQQT